MFITIELFEAVNQSKHLTNDTHNERENRNLDYTI